MASKRTEEIIHTILNEPCFLNENGDIPVWSSKIWKCVSDKLNMYLKDGQKSISDQYLYTLVKQNRYDILNTIRSNLGFSTGVSEKIPIDQTSTSSNESDSTFEGRYQISEIPNSISRQPKKFLVTISKELYEKIKP